MSASDKLKDIINFAIENERAAIDFYTKLLNEVASEEVVNEIRNIIQMEESHRDTLEKIDVVRFTRSLIKQEVDLKIADFVVEQESRPNMTIKDLLNIAMHRERKAVELYSDLAKLFSGDEKCLFENLAAEEGGHRHYFEGRWTEQTNKLS